MVDEDADVFEITDFTTASEWERFVARLEEVFHDWKLSNFSFSQLTKKIDLNDGKWSETNVLLKYADHEFVLSRHTFHPTVTISVSTDDLNTSINPLKTDETLAAKNEDEESKIWHELVGGSNEAFQLFPPRAHCLCRWYGHKDFLILTTPSNADDVFSESRINMLLSSLSIAASNTSCQIPVFVQAHSKWRRLFFGSFETGGFRTNYDMVHLRNIPHFCRYLSALVDIFRNKLACPSFCKPQIIIAVRFTYVLQDFISELWPQDQTDQEKNLIPIEANDNFSFTELPFRVLEDPILELQLSTTWPALSEIFVVENDSYSDFDPLKAPHWSLRLRLADSPTCLLSDYLLEFSKLHLCKESTQQILGKSHDNSDQHSDVDAALALQRLTDPHLSTTLTHVVRRARSTFVIKSEEAPIPIKLLNEILLFIFPDARSDNSKFIECANETNLENNEIKEILKQIKSGDDSSLVWRLAICCCVINARHGGVKALSHLWQEFVMEMRYRWENNFLLPDLESGSPNLANCILYQKLQMLNCCIEKKKSRKGEASSDYLPSGVHRAEDVEQNDEDEEDDEFFECNDGTLTSSPTSKRSESKDKSLNISPEGRSRPLEKYMLIANEEQLYVPVTQEAGPMTEDLLDEQAEIFSRLGTTAEGALLRARLQSASLLSDMEAFKAANPGCILEDFVRWYSPRDWVVAPGCDASSAIGELSQRMQLVGNMWIEIWQSAVPTPVKKQKRLFDDTKKEKSTDCDSALIPLI